MATQKWCAKSCFRAWQARTQKIKSKNLSTPPFVTPDEDIPIAVLEDCYRITASIVTEYGDTYLPIFERLHQEFEKRQAKQLLLKKAFEVSVGNSNKIDLPTLNK